MESHRWAVCRVFPPIASLFATCAMMIPGILAAQIGGHTALDGPFVLDDAEDLALTADGVGRDWITDYDGVKPVLSAIPLAGSGLTLGTGQSPIGALQMDAGAKAGYISVSFGVPTPGVAGGSTLSNPGDISDFQSMTFSFCHQETNLTGSLYRVILETYPGPAYPRIFWVVDAPAGSDFSQITLDLHQPDYVENSGGLTVEQLLAQSRYLAFYFYGEGPASGKMKADIDDIRFTGVVSPTPTPTDTSISAWYLY